MKQKLTKYRTISDGYTEYLQYLDVSRGMFGTIEKWRYVWWPNEGHNDILYGWILNHMHDTHVCEYNNNLGSFALQWPDIEKYFEWARKEQRRLVAIEDVEQAEIDKKRGRTKYL